MVSLIALVAPVAAHATDVQVRVLNTASNRGTVRAAICPRQEFLKPKCPYFGDAPAIRGVTTVRIRGVPPGVYAVQVFHDGNNNGEVDRNLLGMPTEGVGFSRDAPIMFGPPSFEDAKVSISGTLVTLDITLKFER